MRLPVSCLLVKPFQGEVAQRLVCCCKVCCGTACMLRFDWENGAGVDYIVIFAAQGLTTDAREFHKVERSPCLHRAEDEALAQNGPISP